MEIMVYIFLFSFLFSLLWREYKKYLISKYRYKLYSLRDELREYVISGKIKKYDWAFDYLDSSISKTVNDLEKLNFWRAISLYFLHRNDTHIKAFKSNFEVQLNKNEHIKIVYSKYGKIITGYILKKHIITFTISSLGILSLLTSFIAIRKFVLIANSAVKELREFPETSTSLCYAR